jgi:hypothetical protein
MSTRQPPRHLPTLTEVVDPAKLPHAPVPVPSPVPPSVSPFQADGLAAAVASAVDQSVLTHAVPDKHLLSQQVIQLVRPQLENELRSMAQELFEAQFSSLLPSLHLHIEEAVREAIDLALPEPPEA